MQYSLTDVSSLCTMSELLSIYCQESGCELHKDLRTLFIGTVCSVICTLLDYKVIFIVLSLTVILINSSTFANVLICFIWF